MIQKFITLTVFALNIFWGATFTYSQKIEEEISQLKGKIKTVTQSNFHAKENNGEIVAGSKSSSYLGQFFVALNKKQRFTEYIRYKESGEVYFKYIYTYNKKNNCILLVTYQNDDELYSTDSTTYNKKQQIIRKMDRTVKRYPEKHTYSYNDKGLLIKDQHFISFDLGKTWKEYYTNTHEYDSKKNCIKYTNLNSNPNLDRFMTFEYDKKGRKTESRSFDMNGTMLHHYKFDPSGNTIEENAYNSDSTFVFRLTHKFDDHGNDIEYCKYDQNLVLESKRIKKYNEYGDWIESTTYLADGSIDRHHTCTYEYDKNGNWIKKIEYYNNEPSFLTERKIEYW